MNTLSILYLPLFLTLKTEPSGVVWGVAHLSQESSTPPFQICVCIATVYKAWFLLFHSVINVAEIGSNQSDQAHTQKLGLSKHVHIVISCCRPVFKLFVFMSCYLGVVPEPPCEMASKAAHSRGGEWKRDFSGQRV